MRLKCVIWKLLAICASLPKKHIRFHGFAINANELCQRKEITYKFPKGMTCMNKHFNEKEDGRCNLANLLCLFEAVVRWDDAAYKETKQKIIYCYWHMVIDGEMRRIEERSINDGNGLGDVMQGMLNSLFCMWFSTNLVYYVLLLQI
jgi:hypothetical protein